MKRKRKEKKRKEKKKKKTQIKCWCCLLIIIITIKMLPSRYIISVGTYSGVIAGWDSSIPPPSSSSLPSSSTSSGGVGSVGESVDAIETPYQEKQRQQEGSDDEGEGIGIGMKFAFRSHGGAVRDIVASSGSGGNDDDKYDDDNDDDNDSKNKCSPPMMISVGNDGAIRLYDLLMNVEIGEGRLPHGVEDASCCGPFLRDGKGDIYGVIVGTNCGKLVIFKAKTMAVMHVMGRHKDAVSSIAVHPTSTMALSASDKDNTLRLWDLTRGHCVFVKKVNGAGKGNRKGAGPTNVAFSPGEA